MLVWQRVIIFNQSVLTASTASHKRSLLGRGPASEKSRLRRRGNTRKETKERRKASDVRCWTFNMRLLKSGPRSRAQRPVARIRYYIIPVDGVFAYAPIRHLRSEGTPNVFKALLG